MNLRISHFVLFLIIILIGVTIYFAINPQPLPEELEHTIEAEGEYGI